jgi:hypothetical protein
MVDDSERMRKETADKTTSSCRMINLEEADWENKKRLGVTSPLPTSLPRDEYQSDTSPKKLFSSGAITEREENPKTPRQRRIRKKGDCALTSK